MRLFLAALLLLVPVGEGFGQASADGVEIADDRISVELTVEVDGASSVVAHLIEPGGDQQTVSMRDRGDAEYGAVFETRKIDLVVVFEALGQIPRQSEPARLTTLGVDRAVLGMAPPADDLVDVVDDGSNDSSQWGWLGLAFAAGALALLAIWALDEGSERAPRHAASRGERAGSGLGPEAPTDQAPVEPT